MCGCVRKKKKKVASQKGKSGWGKKGGGNGMGYGGIDQTFGAEWKKNTHSLGGKKEKKW